MAYLGTDDRDECDISLIKWNGELRIITQEPRDGIDMEYSLKLRMKSGGRDGKTFNVFGKSR